MLLYHRAYVYTNTAELFIRLCIHTKSSGVNISGFFDFPFKTRISASLFQLSPSLLLHRSPWSLLVLCVRLAFAATLTAFYEWKNTSRSVVDVINIVHYFSRYSAFIFSNFTNDWGREGGKGGKVGGKGSFRCYSWFFARIKSIIFRNSSRIFGPKLRILELT